MPFTYIPQEAATDNGSSLQRESVASQAFIAAAPTPGSGVLNASASEEHNDEPDDTASTTPNSKEQSQDQATPKTKQAPVSSYVPPPAPTLFADAGDDRTVIVGADTEFDGRAYDREQKILESGVRFNWNFGDGSIAEGESVLHHFSYPGRYVVILSIAQNDDAKSDVVIVTAEPAKLTFEVFADGSAAIGNISGHDLDLSGWVIRQFGRQLVLPPHSLVLAGETLRIPQATLSFWANADAELEYPNGVLALKAGASMGAAATTTMQTQAPVVAIVTPVSEQTPVKHVAPAVVSEIISEETPETTTPKEVSATDTVATSSQVASAATFGGRWMWWFAAIVLALLAGGALIAARNAQKTEWDITEEKE